MASYGLPSQPGRGPKREEAEDLLAEKIRLSRKAAPAVENPDVKLGEYAAKWLDAVEQDIES